MRPRRVAALVGATLLADHTYAQLSLDLTRPKPNIGHLLKRDSQTIDLENTLQWGGTYRTQFKIGTPGQFITFGLSTRPSDLIWIPASNSSTCKETTLENYGPCSFGGLDANSSSTFTHDNQTFNLDFGKNRTGDALWAAGVEFQDKVRLGDISISNLTMGYADNVTNGIIPQVSLLFDEEYDAKNGSFIYQLWSQGHIPTMGYSLWLGSQNNDTGQLHLGGIDTSKYEGDLVGFETGGSLLEIPLTSVSASSSTGTDNLTSQLPLSIPLILGTPLSVLPQDLAFEIWAIAGVRDVARGQLPLIPCSLRDSEGIFTLGFGGDEGVQINMTMKELVLDEGIYDPELFPTDDERLCVFGITNSTKWTSWILGESFFRSAYTAIDLDNKMVAIAPSKINADPTKSDVVAFNGNGAPIPSARQLTDLPTPASGSSSEPSILNWEDTGRKYKAAEGFKPLSADGDSSTGSGTGSSVANGDSGLSTGAKVGVGIGVGLGALIVGAGAFLVWRKGKKAGYKPAAKDADQEWTGKPELSGESAVTSDLGKPELSGEVSVRTDRRSDGFQAQSELPGDVPAVEIAGRERPAEMPGDPKTA
ncbi:hypothetical protein ACJ41O_011932 [Fusarium nematophilum]